ncbi:MAG: GAF domain-containing protein [Phenylobacterium sp.]|uniref:GAF domain-containing protein n=1 Tax=Phenylobacterium sp. TaxID=1871053 RepID=UPI003918FA24
MWRFMLKENIRRFRALIDAEPSTAEREHLQRLLLEAESDLQDLEQASTPDLAHRDAALQMLAEQSIDEAMRLLDAQFGLLQVWNEDLDGLVILAQRNFRPQFLHHFALVRPGDGSVCGRSMADGSAVAVDDVGTDPAFEPHRHVAQDAGFRAVLSLPLKATSDAPIGVLSTHFRSSRRFSDQELGRVASHARSVASAVAPHLHA